VEGWWIRSFLCDSVNEKGNRKDDIMRRERAPRTKNKVTGQVESTNM
jgi:hypothetical protein